jgi:hypothetical protein
MFFLHKKSVQRPDRLLIQHGKWRDVTQWMLQ